MLTTEMNKRTKVVNTRSTGLTFLVELIDSGGKNTGATVLTNIDFKIPPGMAFSSTLSPFVHLSVHMDSQLHKHLCFSCSMLFLARQILLFTDHCSLFTLHRFRWKSGSGLQTSFADSGYVGGPVERVVQHE